MANATLADLDDALLTALTALVAGPPTANAPFALAGRYAGPTTKKDLSNVCREQFPAVLLRFERESVTRDILTWAYSEERGESSWSVISVVEDPREVDEGMRGTTTSPGVMRCIDAALGAVNALAAANTYQGITLRAVETRPELVEGGVVYAYATRVAALRVLPQADNPDPAAGLPLLNPMVGDLNLTGTLDDPDSVNPLVEFEAEPNP